MEKIKAFFANRITQIVCVILFVLSSVGLIIGGFTLDNLNGIVVAVGAVISAISALIALIGGLITKK